MKKNSIGLIQITITTAIIIYLLHKIPLSDVFTSLFSASILYVILGLIIWDIIDLKRIYLSKSSKATKAIKTDNVIPTS